MWRRQGMTLLAIGALALALLAAPGCGSDGDDSSSNPQTKVAFVKQAEAICGKGKLKEIKAFTVYTKKSQKLSGQAQARFVVNGALQPIGVVAEELGELDAPEGDEDQVSEIVDAFEGVVEEGREDPGKILGSEAPYRTPDRLAAAYGLKVCSAF